MQGPYRDRRRRGTADSALVSQRYGAHNRLGYAMELGQEHRSG